MADLLALACRLYSKGKVNDEVCNIYIYTLGTLRPGCMNTGGGMSCILRTLNYADTTAVRDGPR